MSDITTHSTNGSRFATIEQVGIVAGNVGVKVYQRIAEQHAKQMAALEAECVRRIAEAEVRIAQAFEARLQAMLQGAKSTAFLIGSQWDFDGTAREPMSDELARGRIAGLSSEEGLADGSLL